MLTMPFGSPPVVSVIGLDPGSHSLGVGILMLDARTLQIVGSEALTLNGDRLAGKNSWMAEVYGDRIARITAMRDTLIAIFRHHQPLDIATESPFYSQRRPQAFSALTEVICAIRDAVMQYDSWKTLYSIDPPTVKMAVGAAGNAPKEIMKEKILGLACLRYNGEIPLHHLDEHSIDALAVAYCRYKSLLEKLCLRESSSV